MIKRFLIFLICIILMTAFVLSPLNRIRFPEKFEEIKESKNKFESQGLLHSSYLFLNDDNSFVYYSIFEVGYDLTIGNYNLNNDIITLNWDSLKTYNAVKDPNYYKKYSKYSTPLPFKINNIRYKKFKNLLLLCENNEKE